MTLYAVCWVLLLILLLRYVKVFQTDALSRWDMPVALMFKFSAGALYIFVYSSVYGTDAGELNYDASDFLYESKQLHDLFFQAPLTYFKLIFEIHDQSELVQLYIDKTIHWSRGNLMLVNDAKNLVKIHSFIQFISFNNIYVHFAIFNFLSLLGLRNLYLALKQYIRFNHRVFFYAGILLPSALFWGSSVLKEPLLIFGMGLFLRGLLDGSISKRKKGIYALLGIIILIGFKPYILICFLLAMAYYLFSSYFFSMKPYLSLLVFLSGIFLSMVLFSGLRRKMVHFISGKQFDFENIGQGGIYCANPNNGLTYYFPTTSLPDLEIHDDYFVIRKPTIGFKYRSGYKDKIIRYGLFPNGEHWMIKSVIPGSDSYIQTTMIFSSFRQMLYNIPEALNNALIRPYFTDPGKNLKYFATIETILMGLFLVFAFWKRRKLQNHERLMLVSAFLFVISLALLVGWTTPVLGAIVRYRMPAYWVLLLIGFILIKPLNEWKINRTTP